MKLEIRRDGWPMKVMQYGGLFADDRTDLCAAFWAFVWGVVRAPFWVALFGFIGSAILFMLVLQPLIVLIAYFSEGAPIQIEFWVTMGVWVLAGAVIYELWAREEEKPCIGSVVQLAKVGYRSWKDKTCVLIDVRD